jgi:DNA-binding NarL/FixJ family response regulator
MNQLPRTRVLLADDHRMVAEGLKTILEQEFDLVGLVEDGRALVNAAKKLRPDVVVADIAMPHLNGIDAMLELRKENVSAKIIFLTMHQEVAYVRRAMESGASGFVLKHSAPAELISAVRAALNGQTYLSPAVAGGLLQNLQQDPTGTQDQAKLLTPRQREILQLLAEGSSAKQTAAVLGISARTVEFHKYQMMEALGLHNSAELVHFAIKHGIVII